MGTPPAWITPEDVLAYLDEIGTPNDNLVLSTAAWRAAVERRHPHYFDDAVPPVYFPPDDIRAGAIRAAALTYKTRIQPTTGDDGTMWGALGLQRGEIQRMLRWTSPVAR